MPPQIIPSIGFLPFFTRAVLATASLQLCLFLFLEKKGHPLSLLAYLHLCSAMVAFSFSLPDLSNDFTSALLNTLILQIMITPLSILCFLALKQN